MTLTIGLHAVPDQSGRLRSHDHGMAVLRDGRIVWASELERRTRVKHDGSMPDHVEAWIAPFLRDDTEVRVALVNGFLGARLVSAGGRLVIDGDEDLALEEGFSECAARQSIVPGTRIRGYTVAHEAAHLGTCLAMFGAFPAGSLFIHVDGGASRSNASAWHYDGVSLRCLEHAWHPGLKGAVNNFNASALGRAILGIDATQHLAMPGKLMGLASYGRFDPVVLDALAAHAFLRDVSLAELHEALRLAAPDLRVGEFSPRDAGCQVLASVMQRHLEEELLAFFHRHVAATGARHVYYAGGAALNVHANTRLERELPIDALCIPPAPSDAGLALGAAAFLAWRLDGHVAAHTAYLNTVDPDARPGRILDAGGVRVLTRARDVAAAIAAGAVVGVVAGDAELGPRALGHRSLLCRADSVPLRRRVSETMKRREWYRPVAPILGRAAARSLLEAGAETSGLAAWMLGAYRVAPDGMGELAGAVHVDGTVRAQIVEPGAPGLAHIEDLLEVLEREHGIRALINTSFNRAGEPIVHSAADAVGAGPELGVDAIWVVG